MRVDQAVPSLITGVPSGGPVETYAIVNRDGGYAYVNIAKAGCTSVKTAIARHIGIEFEQLMWSADLKVRASWVPNDVHRFTVVRHPFARLVSCWADYIMNPRLQEIRLNPQFRPMTGMPFPEFLSRMCRGGPEPNLHYAPQWGQLFWHGRPLVDQIIKLEEIDREWPLLMDRFGMPPLPTDPDARRETPHGPWETYYTPRLRRIAARYYAEDFQYLGYDRGE